MRPWPKAQQGQTIMEVMVAVFIMSMALAAILSLVTYSIYGQKASEQQIIAQQLAREGIEVVRNFRDSDALKAIPSSDSAYRLLGSASEIMRVSFDPTTNAWALTACPTGDCSDFSNLNYRFKLNTNPNPNLYRHVGFLTAGTYTPYYRRLKLHHVCRDTTGAETLVTSGTCASPAVRVGTRVTSEVQWTGQSGTRTVVLYDYLYDWK